MNLSDVIKGYERAVHLKALSKIIEDEGFLVDIGAPHVKINGEDNTTTVLYIAISDKSSKPIMDLTFVIKQFFESEFCVTPQWLVEELITNLIPTQKEASIRILLSLFKTNPTNHYFSTQSFENFVRNIFKLERIHQITLPKATPLIDRNGRVLHDATRSLDFELFPQTAGSEVLWLKDRTFEKVDIDEKLERFVATGVSLRFTGNRSWFTVISHSAQAHRVPNSPAQIFNCFSHSVPMSVEVYENKVVFDCKHGFMLENFGKEKRQIFDLLISIFKLDYKSGIDFEITFTRDNDVGIKRNPIPFNLHGSFDPLQIFKTVESCFEAFKNGKSKIG
jgi:hypothetical protein